jgi:hypothetical protein
MTESTKKRDKTGTAPPSSSTAPSHLGGSPKRTFQQFEDIYSAYMTALQNALLAAQDQLRDMNRDYLQSLNGVQTEVNKQVHEASQHLRKASDEAAGSENAPERWAASHREYADTLNTVITSGWKRSEEIKRNHWDAVEAARVAHCKSNDASYQSFLAEMRNAWAGVDPAAVDVNNLNLISHLMLAASQTARMAMCHI